MVYVLTSAGTLGMLFFGFGTVQENERSILINTFLVESGVAIFSFFYSIFGIKTRGNNSEKYQDLLDKVKTLENNLEKKNAAIKDLSAAIASTKNNDLKNQSNNSNALIAQKDKNNKRENNAYSTVNFISIDAITYTSSNNNSFKFPLSSFQTLREIIVEIEEKLSGIVKHREYGKSWVLLNEDANAILIGNLDGPIENFGIFGGVKLIVNNCI